MRVLFVCTTIEMQLKSSNGGEWVCARSSLKRDHVHCARTLFVSFFLDSDTMLLKKSNSRLNESNRGYFNYPELAHPNSNSRVRVFVSVWVFNTTTWMSRTV